jgi:hypothetical protein
MEGMETKEKTEEIMEHGRNRFNRMVAVAVAMVAVLMTLGKIKSEKIVEHMLAVQATELDQWNYYQSKSIKQHLYQLQVEQWRLQQESAVLSPSGTTAIKGQLAKWGAEIKRYDKEKADAQEGAERARKEYEHLELRNDQFHFTEALFSLSIALLAVASLARSRMLFGLGLFFAACGVGMGLAGFLGWTVRVGLGMLK